MPHSRVSTNVAGGQPVTTRQLGALANISSPHSPIQQRSGSDRRSVHAAQALGQGKVHSACGTGWNGTKLRHTTL